MELEGGGCFMFICGLIELSNVALAFYFCEFIKFIMNGKLYVKLLL